MDVVEEHKPGEGEVGEIIETRRRSPAGPADWSFVRSPRWILSHLFALGLILVFIAAGFWQLSRLGDRRDANERVESRALQEPMALDTVMASAGDLTGADLDEALDFTAVTVRGRFIVSELTRVANRSQDGRGGDWSVGLFETVDGQILVVNRGFLLRSEIAAEAPDGEVTLTGFLRRTRTKGWIGSDDDPTAERMPRLNIDEVIVRAEAAGIDASDRTIDLWLQLSEIDGSAPDAVNETGSLVEAVSVPRPVPLGDLDEGDHFSYAIQWFSLAVLSVMVYGLMLRRVATRGGTVESESLG